MSNELQLFYRGGDDSVRSRWRNHDGTWSDEQTLGGKVTGEISASRVPGTDVLQLFAHSGDNKVWSRWRNADGTWSEEHTFAGIVTSGESNLGGKLASGVTAVQVPGTDLLQLFYLGGDYKVLSRWRNPDGTWSGESFLGGIAISAITAVRVP